MFQGVVDCLHQWVLVVEYVDAVALVFGYAVAAEVILVDTPDEDAAEAVLHRQVDLLIDFGLV